MLLRYLSIGTPLKPDKTPTVPLPTGYGQRAREQPTRRRGSPFFTRCTMLDPVCLEKWSLRGNQKRGYVRDLQNEKERWELKRVENEISVERDRDKLSAGKSQIGSLVPGAPRVRPVGGALWV